MFSDSRKRRGWIRIAQYRYAVPLKNGKWTVYEGSWSDTGEDYIAGLSVVKDNAGKPVRFDTLEKAKEEYRDSWVKN